MKRVLTTVSRSFVIPPSLFKSLSLTLSNKRKFGSPARRLHTLD